MLKQYVVPALVLVACAATFSYFTAGFSDADITANAPVLGPAVTDPTALTSDENNNIRIYREVSPSVVFVTNTQLRRRLFSLNVMEAPAGSGTGTRNTPLPKTVSLIDFVSLLYFSHSR